MKKNESILKGVNLGGWLLREGYLLGSRNIPEKKFNKKFQEKHGKKELAFFEESFRNKFIQKKDFKKISSWGLNCIRIPFHYRIFESKPFEYDNNEIFWVKKALKWAEEFNLNVILDLHAACGSQNFDWHSDSSGKAELWRSKTLRKRVYSLWSYIANEFKNEKSLYGYDVLNEPVLGNAKESVLINLYKDIVKAIRNIDKKRIIYLEGSQWGQNIEIIKDILSENISVSVHTYEPYLFTFNLRPNLKYPGMIDSILWNKDRIKSHLKSYYEFSIKYNVPVFVGEFGINYRENAFGELDWLNDILEIFDSYKFSWTIWTYKSIYHNVFPSGILQYYDNPLWVRREGPVYGIENYYDLWKNKKEQIIDSFDSKHYSINSKLLHVIEKFTSKE